METTSTTKKEKKEKKERIQLLINPEIAKKFRGALTGREEGIKQGDISKEITTLIRENLSRLKSDSPLFLQEQSEEPDEETLKQIEFFYKKINTMEKYLGRGLIILKDNKTNVYYTECHLNAKELIENNDIDALINPDEANSEEQEEYRMNRKIIKSHAAYKQMIFDAENGRQFSDLVIEYNTTYRSKIPLKILGGQHRVEAIKIAFEKQNRIHGIRAYFNIRDVSKRREIAEIANTNINISLDLRDRMHEQELLPAGKLKEWTRNIGLLQEGKQFAEKRLREQEAPTVKMMRTFVVNFVDGKDYKEEISETAVVPYSCKSGGMDEKYLKIFKKVNGEFDKIKGLSEAGKEFLKLHKKQFSNSQGPKQKQYRYRTLNLAIIAAWTFTAGNLQGKKFELNKLYKLPVVSVGIDPLHGEEMDEVRHLGDPQGYKMGVRFGSKERGRFLQAFYSYATIGKYSELDKKVYNLAVKVYHFNKTKEEIKKLKEER